MPKIGKLKISFNTLFWLTILIIYQLPTLVFLGYKIGVGKQMVDDILGVEVKLKSSWYPSPYFYWEQLFSQEGDRVEFIKHNFLFPLSTDFDSITIFKSDLYGDLEFVKEQSSSAVETAFGEVWKIYEGRPKWDSYVVPTHNIKVKVSNPSLLNEIILMREFK